MGNDDKIKQMCIMYIYVLKCYMYLYFCNVIYVFFNLNRELFTSLKVCVFMLLIVLFCVEFEYIYMGFNFDVRIVCFSESFLLFNSV